MMWQKKPRARSLFEKKPSTCAHEQAALNWLWFKRGLLESPAESRSQRLAILPVPTMTSNKGLVLNCTDLSQWLNTCLTRYYVNITSVCRAYCKECVRLNRTLNYL